MGWPRRCAGTGSTTGSDGGAQCITIAMQCCSPEDLRAASSQGVRRTAAGCLVRAREGHLRRRVRLGGGNRAGCGARAAGRSTGSTRFPRKRYSGLLGRSRSDAMNRNPMCQGATDATACLPWRSGSSRASARAFRCSTGWLKPAIGIANGAPARRGMARIEA